MSQTPSYNFFSDDPVNRLPEIDLRIIEDMDDEPLRSYCLSSHYNASLCDDTFWSQRIKSRGLELLLPYRSLYASLAAFYFGVRKDACYIVATTEFGTEEDAFMFNDPTLAYRRLIELVRLENGIDEPEDDALLDLTGLVSSYDIYIMFDDVIVKYADRAYYSIFNLRLESKVYRNPKIFQYPELQHAEILAYYYDNDSLDMGITSLTREKIRMIPKEATMLILQVAHWDKEPIRWHQFVLGWKTENYYHIDDGTYDIVLPDKVIERTEVLLVPKNIMLFIENLEPQQLLFENRDTFSRALYRSNVSRRLNGYAGVRKITDLSWMLDRIYANDYQ